MRTRWRSMHGIQSGESACQPRVSSSEQQRRPLGGCSPPGQAEPTVCVGSIMASTKLHDSVVQERTVSVLPSRKSRVMEAS